jgi:hypothetical protein
MYVVLTSSSILASAMSASLPLPLAIFWASAIWFLTACCDISYYALDLSIMSSTSALKSSSGYPSTALMLRIEPGCTVANPPERKNCLLPPCSSMISTRPGFNCSMEGTWPAKTPMSPVSAGRLTWTLYKASCQFVFAVRCRSDQRGTYTSCDLYMDYAAFC